MARLWVSQSLRVTATPISTFFFPTMGCGVVVVVVVWVDQRRWVARLWVGLWVDQCVRGGGSGGFCGGGYGCCLVGLVDRCVCGGGSAWLIFFFLCCGLWW